ncbi:MAG: helix-hairpin-helix domain-containing protein [Ignavibacteria bacterium]
MKDIINVLKNAVSFTKNEIQVIIFIAVVTAAGYSVKYYKSLADEKNTGYDYSRSDSIFKERSLKIYAGNDKRNNDKDSSQDETSIYKAFQDAEDSVRLSEKIKVENEIPEFVIDINSADISELTELPGIGESIAARIKEYRDKNKKFGSINEIMQVKGIGKKKFEKIKKYIKAD